MSKTKLGCGFLLLPLAAGPVLMGLVHTVLADWLVTPRLEPADRGAHLTVCWIFGTAGITAICWLAALVVFFSTRDAPSPPSDSTSNATEPPRRSL